MIARLVMILALLLMSQTVFAQCPYGMPNNPGCIPPDVWNAQKGGQPAQQQSRWVYTWGALAKEMGGGPLGVSTGRNSERDAKKVAIKDCQRQGGKKCEILLSYYHQCTAVATGKTVSASSGPDLDEVKERALARCNSMDGAGECYIYYSNCTEPYLVR